MDADLLVLFHALATAGLWLRFDEKEHRLLLGPESLVRQHPDYLAQVRQHKPAIIETLLSMQEHTLFCRVDADPRFAHACCSECGQQVYIMLKPRRLAAHRLPDNQTVCPGSDRAQLIVAEQILEAFLADRCVERPGGLLTWESLQQALQAWCTERDLWLPPPQYLQQWLTQRFGAYQGKGRKAPLGPVWEGLTLTQLEWLGDEEHAAAPPIFHSQDVRHIRPVTKKKATLTVPGAEKQAPLL